VRRWATRYLLVVLLVLAACGSRGMSRDQLYDHYVDELMKGGIPAEVAECVIEHLFDPMSDQQLKAFNQQGDELTAAQMDQVRALAAQCRTAS
jgi:hypothetical protein